MIPTRIRTPRNNPPGGRGVGLVPLLAFLANSTIPVGRGFHVLSYVPSDLNCTHSTYAALEAR